MSDWGDYIVNDWGDWVNRWANGWVICEWRGMNASEIGE